MNTAIEELWGPDEEQALLDSIDAWVEKSVAPIAMAELWKTCEKPIRYIWLGSTALTAGTALRSAR